jgi:DNA primase large subunit
MAVRRTPPVDLHSLFGEYPFLPGAEALVQELAPSVGDLFADPIYERSRLIGRARIRSAIDDPTGATGVEELAHASPDERFLSFQFARLLLSAAPGRAPLRRWAVAEAKRGAARLAKEPEAVRLEVARRLGFAFASDGEETLVPLPDYLRLATAIREGEFRLARQAVRGGLVRVAHDRGVRLLQEGVRISLSEPVALAAPARSAIEERERSFLEEVAARLPAPVTRAGAGLGPLRPELFPPCVRAMRRMMEGGENLSHSGRFALAAFLHRAGANYDAIVDAYRGAPDFDESVTRYQVEHITRRDDGRGYEPPDCATLRTHGLCFREGDPQARDPAQRRPDRLCFEERLRKPLQYYRIRLGGSAPPAGAAAASGPPPGPTTTGGASGTSPGPSRTPSTAPR